MNNIYALQKMSLIIKLLQVANCLSSLLCFTSVYQRHIPLPWPWHGFPFIFVSSWPTVDRSGSGLVAVTPNMMWWEWGGGTEKRKSCIIKKSAAIRDIYTVEWSNYSTDTHICCCALPQHCGLRASAILNILPGRNDRDLSQCCWEGTQLNKWLVSDISRFRWWHCIYNIRVVFKFPWFYTLSPLPKQDLRVTSIQEKHCFYSKIKAIGCTYTSHFSCLSLFHVT